jgi:Fe-S-cluster-containing dehydrogenase component
MPNYGFAIDLRKCIGCHACTIACKAEHEIPIGVNRCWVKTVEKGTFPDTRRFFFPVLCNQCDDAPCARICPTNALYRRRDGIVDLHGDSCIGCRACMVACPYDQLFIDPNTHTAEKCNFCANRVENQLLPACVSVCPTECRIFGDLDDPSSEVAKIAQMEAMQVRKPEKGTLPKVFYLGADDSVIRPEAATRPFIYKEGQVLLRPLGSPAADPLQPGAPRVDYDTPHVKPWGLDMALTSSQKAFALPPGLAFAAVSDRVLERAKEVKNRGYYFDFLEFKKSQEGDMTPTTPSIGHIHALESKLDDIFSEGLTNRYDRHARTNALVHDWVRRTGFAFFAEEGFRSKALTCVRNNRAIDVAKLVRDLRAKHHLVIDGGYGKIKGQTFRLSNMGDETDKSVSHLLSCLDDCLR